jgi:hypothetical protein
MSKFPRDGFEAIGAEVFVEPALALMVFDIADPNGEKIRIHMRRTTFDDLAGRIAEALFGPGKPVRER